MIAMGVRRGDVKGDGRAFAAEMPAVLASDVFAALLYGVPDALRWEAHATKRKQRLGLTVSVS